MQQHFPDSLVIQISLLQGMTLHPQPVIAVSPQNWKKKIVSLFYVKVYKVSGTVKCMRAELGSRIFDVKVLFF